MKLNGNVDAYSRDSMIMEPILFCFFRPSSKHRPVKTRVLIAIAIKFLPPLLTYFQFMRFFTQNAIGNFLCTKKKSRQELNDPLISSFPPGFSFFFALFFFYRSFSRFCIFIYISECTKVRKFLQTLKCAIFCSNADLRTSFVRRASLPATVKTCRSLLELTINTVVSQALISFKKISENVKIFASWMNLS